MEPRKFAENIPEKFCANWAKCVICRSKPTESMGKQTIVRMAIARIKQNVRIIQGSHYPGSTVRNMRKMCPVSSWDRCPVKTMFLKTGPVILPTCKAVLLVRTWVDHAHQPLRSTFVSQLSSFCDLVIFADLHLEGPESSKCNFWELSPLKSAIFMPWSMARLNQFPSNH